MTAVLAANASEHDDSGMPAGRRVDQGFYRGLPVVTIQF